MKARREFGDHLLDGPTIGIPDQFKEKVIFFDLVGHDAMLVFCSFGMQMLADFGDHVCIDGTFKCRPLAFSQLYTIHALIDRTAVPVVYGLLGNKE